MSKRPLIGVALLGLVAAAIAIVLRRREAPPQAEPVAAPEPAAPAEPAAPEQQFDQMTREELYKLAKERDIPGRSKMTKKQLVAALRKRP